MRNIEILKKFIDDNNGIILSSHLKKLNIHKQYLKILCDEKYINKIEKGVYAIKGKNVNEFFYYSKNIKLESSHIIQHYIFII